MKINFHDLHSQYMEYKDEINAAIQSVLNSSQFIMGEAVYHFENQLARYLGSSNVISCASGTDALLLALMAIDIKPGDEVITTPFTFIATAEVISLLGATPVFAEIQANTYNIDPNSIEEKITSKTRAIIPVSLFGQPADLDDISHISNIYGNKWGSQIYVIEDAAQSLGARYKDKLSASVSDIGCLSFFPTKPLGCYGDGGAIVVKDSKIAEKIKSLRIHGQTNRYFHKYIGFNCRLDTLQAAILQVKLKYLDAEIKKRQAIAKNYDYLLADLEVKLPYICTDRTSVYAQYSICSVNRTLLLELFKQKNVPVAIHYPQALHLQECFKYLGYKKGDFPIAEKVTKEIFSLPMSAFVTTSQQDFIASVIRNDVRELVC